MFLPGESVCVCVLMCFIMAKVVLETLFAAENTTETVSSTLASVHMSVCLSVCVSSLRIYTCIHIDMHVCAIDAVPFPSCLSVCFHLLLWK